jgi:hypothetical protein
MSEAPSLPPLCVFLQQLYLHEQEHQQRQENPMLYAALLIEEI